MDELDRRIINGLQGNFPIAPRPFREAARNLGTDEATLLNRLEALLEQGILTRFGPLYNADRLGGAFTLCAMSVPAADFERVAGLINALPEVAHNYEREHRLNMWFVLATGDPARITQITSRIESQTGCGVLELPKEAEYFVDLRLAA